MTQDKNFSKGLFVFQNRRWFVLIAAQMSGLLLTVLCCYLLVPVTPVQADNPIFTFHRAFGIGAGCTYSLATGDMNSDGLLDLVEGNTKSLCNQELGINSQDIVAMNQEINRQVGFFPVTTINPVGNDEGEALDIAVGDMNGDGALDIVVGNGYMSEDDFPQGRQSYVYFNDGRGNFNIETDINCTAPPINVRCFGSENDLTTSVAVGDMNNDGFLDIVASSVSTTLPAASYNQIFLNDGTGNFGNSLIFDSFTGSIFMTVTMKLVVGDLNNDGLLDIVGGNSGVALGPTGPSFIGRENKVYLNDGVTPEPNFESRAFGNAEDISRGLALGDLNNDGFLDIVVGNGFTFQVGGEFLKQPNYYYLNDQSANFDMGVRYSAEPDYPTLGVAVGDLNSDGFLDIIAGNFTGPNEVFFNNGNAEFPQVGRQTFGTGVDATVSIMVADLTNDGALDIIVGNIGQNLIYLNNQDSDASESLYIPLGPGNDHSLDVALANIVNITDDEDLDIIVANNGQNVIYINDNGQFDTEKLFGTGLDNTSRVIAADMNGDKYIDLIVGNKGARTTGGYTGEQNIVYLNDGYGNFNSDNNIDCASPPPNVRCFGPSTSPTTGMAVGDLNGDSYVDVVVNNDKAPNLVYLNDGGGSLSVGHVLGSNTDDTLDVVTGDIDRDGDLDIAVSNANFDEFNLLYLNDGAGRFQQYPVDCSDPPSNVLCFGAKSDLTSSLSMADVNGDGALDLIAGNTGQQNKIYLNVGLQFNLDIRPFGTGGDLTQKVVSRDVNGDGFNDLIVGNGIVVNNTSIAETNVIYFNDGTGHFSTNNARILGSAIDTTSSIAIGDLDGNGTLDYIVANQEQQNQILFNLSKIAANLVNNPPYIQIEAPYPSANTDSGASPVILDSRFISIPFKLYDLEQNTVGHIKAYFSQDGGDNWQSAVASSNTITTNLATSLIGVTHVYTWDTFLSGFYGLSDNVIFRIEAYLQPITTGVTNTYTYTNEIPGPFYWTYSSATTFPFRVRGLQVQVMNNSGPVSNAIVYHQPSNSTELATPLVDFSGKPFVTDQYGYLQGRGELKRGDQLVALHSISDTQNFSIYQTSATVLTDGLRMHPVITPGVQQLVISPDNTLVLFDLVVSLEWDARQDSTFMAQLQNDLRRASEILYDISNGQAALGNIHIYHDKGYWGHANIVIRASNRQRPSAVLGGIVLTPTLDIGFMSPDATTTSVITGAYIPGQIAMPPQWNRFGEPDGTIGEDWPRTLAHELGHYLFFVPDNYLGLNEHNRLTTLVNCPGSVMTDPYQDSYSEFLTKAEWEDAEHSSPSALDCNDTLAEKYLSRSDWETITFQEVITTSNTHTETITFWPMLNGTDIFTGPNLLPLATTQIELFEHTTPPMPIAAPFFNLIDSSSRAIAISPGQGEAYLIKTQDDISPTNDYIITLGTPVGNLVQARGAAPGDRLCVYDYSHDPFRFGCLEEIGNVATSVVLQEMPPDWNPQVQVTPINSTTVSVTVTNVPSSSQLYIQLLPALGTASAEISITQGISKVITATDGAYYGHLRIWVEDSSPLQEMIIEFMGIEDWGGQAYAWGGQAYAWGSPAPGWGGQAYAWGGQAYAWGGQAYAWGAPVMSGDGQVSIFPLENLFGSQRNFTLQKLPLAPDLPSWLLPVGQAYRVTVSGEMPESDILFRYLGADVPGGQEANLRIYYSPDEGVTWQRLDTEPDPLHNHASAKVQSEGTYILVATIEVLPSLEIGWNSFGYPVQETRLITEALASIDGSYTAVANYDPSHIPPWRTYYVTVTAPFITATNTLTQLEYTRAYWLNATEAITLYLRPDGGPGTSLHMMEGIQLPPATFYGWITPTTGFTPTAGMTVTAWIGDNLCGQTTIHQQQPNGELYYVLQVMSENLVGGSNGCGLKGDNVVFHVGDWVMDHHHLWQNHLAWFHPLSQPLAAVAGLTAMNNGPTKLGQITTLTAVITAGSNVSYIWDFGDLSSPGYGMTTAHLYDAPGVYKATVTAENSMITLTDTTKVIVVAPVAELTADNVNLILLSKLATTARALTGTNISYHWD